MQLARGSQFERLREKVLCQLSLVLLKQHVPTRHPSLAAAYHHCSRHRKLHRYKGGNLPCLTYCDDQIESQLVSKRLFYTQSQKLCSDNGDKKESGTIFIDNVNDNNDTEYQPKNVNERDEIDTQTGIGEVKEESLSTEERALSDTTNEHTEHDSNQSAEATALSKNIEALATKNKHESARMKQTSDKGKYDAKTLISNNFLDVNDFPVEEDIVNLLGSYEIPYDEGFTGYHMVCPKFGKLAMKKRKKEQRLYVNTKSGYFVCNACKMSGYWGQLKENILCQKAKKALKSRVCFKDVAGVTRQVEEVPADVAWHLDSSQPFSQLSDEQFDNILAIFDWHGITRSTFAEFGVRCRIQDNQYEVVFPVHSLRTGLVTAVRVYRGSLSDDDTRVTITTFPRYREVMDLFGAQHQPTAKTLVITSGEVNALAIAQATKTTVLALRNTTQLPLEILAPLEEFTKIILWIGTDVNAWECTNAFARKLNDRRCYIFRLNTVLKMPLQLLQEDEDLKQFVLEARIISHKDIVKFTHLRGDVYTELAHLSQVAGVQWKRYTALNRLMKGHRRGELTVLTGPTGSGKTTFASDYSLDLCMQGVNTLWGSFEINNVKLAKMMLRQFSGKDLTKHLEDFDQVADQFASVPMYYMTYFGQENINKVLEVMTHAVYVHDISHVVIDNLQFMMGMDFTESNRFIKQDHIVATFRRFATEKNCHVTLITHPRKVDDNDMLSTASIFGSAKLSQEADNVLLIQDLMLNKTLGRVKLLQIAKNRFDGELDILMMNFNRESLTFNLKEKAKKGKKENKDKDKQLPQNDDDDNPSDIQN